MKSIISLFCIVFLFNLSFSQMDPPIPIPIGIQTYQGESIVLEFDSKKWKFNPENLKELKRGEFYQLKITGINQNVWKVSINNQDSSLSPKLDLTALTGFNTDALTMLLSSITNSTSSFVSSGDDRSELFDKSGESVKSVDDLKLQILEVVSEIDDLMDSAYKDIATIGLHCGEDSIECKQITGFFDEISLIRESLRQQSTASLESKKLFVDAAMKDDTKELTKEEKEYVAKYDALLKTIETGLNLIKHDEVKKIADQLAAYARNSSNEYTSLPIQFTEDQTKLSIDITPHDSNSRLPSFSTSLTFPTYKKTYLAIGAGLYFAPGLRNDRFSVQGNALGDSTFRLIEEDPIRSEMGASVLVRYGWRHLDNGALGFHLSAGTGFSFTNPIKPRVLFGAGISGGDRHRVAFDAGLIAGYVDRLSNAFDLNQEYGIKPESVVVSQVQASVFFSIGYIYNF